MRGSHRAGNAAAIGLGDRKTRIVAVALAVYAVAVPLTLSILLETSASLASPLLSTLWLAMVIVGPGGGVVAGVLRGPARIARELAAQTDKEPQQIVIRLFFPGFVLIYLVGLAVFGAAGDRLVPLLAVVIAGVLCEWLLFIDLISRPGSSSYRRAAAMLSDVGFISIFLHIGGALAAPWFSTYFWVVLGFGFGFGRRALVAAALMSLAGFGAVWASTPFWREQPLAASGVVMALVLLSAYAASLLGSLTLAKAAAEEANAAKNRFLAVMSQELRAPLNGMIGTASLLGRTGLDAEQRDMLAAMQLSARALLGVINDILDFAKIEAGKLQPEIESFALHEVLGATVAMLRPQAEAKGLSLALRIDPRLPHAYRGLPLQLRQILVNLITNAIKATPQGRVEVSARLLARENDTIGLRLAVRDEGAGIAAEARGTIFDVFNRANGLATRRPGGAGLGLVIAKQLTRLMSGTIAVESAPDKGNTFIVDVPLHYDAVAAARPPDLAGREAIILTTDADLAASLQAKLGAWHGAVHWLGEDEAVLRHLGESPADAPRAILVVDGRLDPLAALSLAHRLAALATRPPLTLFLAAAGGADSVAGLGASQLAAILEAPLADGALASALLAASASDVQPAQAAAAARETVAASAPAGPPLPAPARKLRILIAEHDGANRKILRRILEMAGHQTAVVDDGEAALAVLDRDRFDLVLLDVAMPELSGYEVAKLYRMEHLGEGRLPLIALAADAASETERQCREGGMDAVLTKPVEATQLLAAIDETYARVTSPGGGASVSPVVTPISAHPRYFADAGAVVDEATIEALRMLGGGSEFLGDVIETFCTDGKRLLDHLREAAVEGDLRAFKELLHSLRSGAANVGAARLCQTVTTLRDVTGKDLRQNGTGYIEKLQAEFAKLETTLGRMSRETRIG
ncbi:MAG TPA: ATP-binding protein [Stellaceae bacterium]|nr:ATP-binding protein [Stellaceae bacterium]